MKFLDVSNIYIACPALHFCTMKKKRLFQKEVEQITFIAEWQ